MHRSLLTGGALGLENYLAATAAAMALGAMLAFLLVRTDLPAKSWMRTLLVIHAGVSRTDEVDSALWPAHGDHWGDHLQHAGFILASNLMVRRATRGAVGF